MTPEEKAAAIAQVQERMKARAAQLVELERAAQTHMAEGAPESPDTFDIDAEKARERGDIARAEFQFRREDDRKADPEAAAKTYGRPKIAGAIQNYMGMGRLPIADTGDPEVTGEGARLGDPEAKALFDERKSQAKIMGILTGMHTGGLIPGGGIGASALSGALGGGAGEAAEAALMDRPAAEVAERGVVGAGMGAGLGIIMGLPAGLARGRVKALNENLDIGPDLARARAGGYETDYLHGMKPKPGSGAAGLGPENVAKETNAAAREILPAVRAVDDSVDEFRHLAEGRQFRENPAPDIDTAPLVQSVEQMIAARKFPDGTPMAGAAVKELEGVLNALKTSAPDFQPAQVTATKGTAAEMRRGLQAALEKAKQEAGGMAGTGGRNPKVAQFEDALRRLDAYEQDALAAVTPSKEPVARTVNRQDLEGQLEEFSSRGKADKIDPGKAAMYNRLSAEAADLRPPEMKAIKAEDAANIQRVQNIKKATGYPAGKRVDAPGDDLGEGAIATLEAMENRLSQLSQPKRIEMRKGLQELVELDPSLKPRVEKLEAMLAAESIRPKGQGGAGLRATGSEQGIKFYLGSLFRGPLNRDPLWRFVADKVGPVTKVAGDASAGAAPDGLMEHEANKLRDYVRGLPRGETQKDSQ